MNPLHECINNRRKAGLPRLNCLEIDCRECSLQDNCKGNREPLKEVMNGEMENNR